MLIFIFLQLKAIKMALSEPDEREMMMKVVINLINQKK